MHSILSFWNDESGSIVSAEIVTIGAVVALGAVTAAQTASSTIDEELRDVTRAIRNLNQSYSYKGFRGCNSMTAGSTFADAANVLPSEPTEKSPGKSPQKSPEKAPGNSQIRKSAQLSAAGQGTLEETPDAADFDGDVDDEPSLEFDDNGPVILTNENNTPGDRN